jgi:hypothetical protein
MHTKSSEWKSVIIVIMPGLLECVCLSICLRACNLNRGSSSTGKEIPSEG